MTHRLSNRCREEKKNFQLSPHRLFTLSGLRPLNNIELASTSLFFISFTLAARIWAQFKQEHINGSINDVRLRTRASSEMVLMSEQMWCHDSQMTFSSAISERVDFFWHYGLKNSAGYDYALRDNWCWFYNETHLCLSRCLVTNRARHESTCKKETIKDIPQTLKKAICLTCLRLSRLTE